MRAIARVDDNQREIVTALRRAGATVQSLHQVGGGCPDLAVGIHGVTLLMEVKRGNAHLTQWEEQWHATWAGQVCVVRTVEDALRQIGALDE